jgi:multisubunit Na+/H+ antiporter MnhG subunit
MPPIETISLAVGLALLLLHLLTAIIFFRRLRAGKNGLTLALLLHMLAVALFLVVAIPSNQEPWQLISRVLLLASVINLIASARIEAHRPLRKQTSLRNRLYRKLD